MNCKCGRPIEWTDWDYFKIPGYKTRDNKCECQEPSFQSEPVTKEKRLIWETIRPEPKGDL